MSLTIGRVGLANEYLNEVEAHAGSGAPGSTTTKLRGVIQAATLAETLAMRDELVSQADYGAVIAVTWSEDSTVDGYYRVTGQTFDLRSLTDKGFIKFSTDLERIGAHPESALQSNLLAALRTNDHSINENQVSPSFGTPIVPEYLRLSPLAAGSLSMVQWTVAEPGKQSSVSPVSASADTAGHFYVGGINTLDLETIDPIWGAPAGLFYNAGCEIYTDGILRAGIRLGDAAASTPPPWVITNGIVRVAPSLTPLSNHFETRLFGLSGAWESVTDWVFNFIGNTDVRPIETVEILRNDPEAAAIRLGMKVTSQLYSNWISVDLMVRRGLPIVFVTVSAFKLNSSFTPVASLRCGETASTITGGLERSTDDTDNNRWNLYASGDLGVVTFDTVNGAAEYDLSTVSGTIDTFDFGIGHELNGSSANFPFTSEDISNRYYAIVQERVVPVHR